MISAPDRERAVALINAAVASGCRKYKACDELGITVRTCQRWTVTGEVRGDGRPDAIRAAPSNKLTTAERERILMTMQLAAYKDLPPSQVVPTLADSGEYIASESSFYRVLHDARQQHHRGRSKAPVRKVATTHVATGPNQLWCWDITWLPGAAKGFYFYLYLILDVYSRKVVGWEVHERESSEQASTLVARSHLREKVGTMPLVLHSDNGSPMKGASLMETLYRLNVVSSYSRPRVSNDNAYAESIFRTCKYRPNYPSHGFADITIARSWVLQFVHWYNHQHKHSGLKFVSPIDRHKGNDGAIFTRRDTVYAAAKARNPKRWSGNTRKWALPGYVCLNPEKEQVVLNKTG